MRYIVHEEGVTRDWIDSGTLKYRGCGRTQPGQRPTPPVLPREDPNMNLPEGNDNPSPIQRSARLLNDLVSVLKTLMDGHQTERSGLHIKYLSLFLVYTIRQVRGICILVGDEPTQKYAEQAGQLLRCLCEIYAKAAWMMTPDDEQGCAHRAWRLEKASVQKEPLSDAQKQELFESLGIIAYENTSSHLKGLPSKKDMFTTIGRSDLYEIYQYESSAIHMSLTTLGTTVHSIDPTDGTVILDGPNPPTSSAKRLVATLNVLLYSARVLISGLGLDSQAWEDVEEVRWREIVSLLEPILSET